VQETNALMMTSASAQLVSVPGNVENNVRLSRASLGSQPVDIEDGNSRMVGN